MTDAARRRAEACFAVARSATIPGERAAAINRGTAIAEAAGLSLDDFDIPGRIRAARLPEQGVFFEGGGPTSNGYFFTFTGQLTPNDPRWADLQAAVLEELNRRWGR